MRLSLLVATTVIIMGVPTNSAAQQPAAGDTSALIANALSAAPASIADGAKVMLMDGTVLRAGTNGWTCLPDDPDRPNNSPMCLDAAWLAFFDAYVNRTSPRFDGIGFGYMLQNDMPVSNTDPFATEPTPDNQWIAEGVPHIMMIVSDARVLDELPTDPDNGGPWVMWKGTPYAHVMIPTVARTTPPR
jgi:hypothetical protein